MKRTPLELVEVLFVAVRTAYPRTKDPAQERIRHYLDRSMDELRKAILLDNHKEDK